MNGTETLWWVLTRRCNLACGYCYQGTDHGAAIIRERGLAPFMTAEVLELARPWAARWAQRGLTVVLYGGEPLLNFNLVREQVPKWEDEFARHTWTAGDGKTGTKEVSFTCTTNGTLLLPPVRRFFDEHQVGVLLSLDGPPRLHDRQRTYSDGSPSWSMIPVDEILAWRPEVEIAWQLDPAADFGPEDLDWMLERGFRRINFNLQWLVDWPAEARVRLERFMRYVFIRYKEGKLLGSNWVAKLETALTVDAKMAQPCGTGLHMLALTPEGWLYPSQEMAFTVFEPGKAPGTAEHYRVGDVRKDQVIDGGRLLDVSQIKTEQMRTPPGYDCRTCVANSVSIGGCHCRYVGQDGTNPANRFEVAPGYCPSMVSAVTGLLQGAAITRHVRPVEWLEKRHKVAQQKVRPPAATARAVLLPLAGWGR